MATVVGFAEFSNDLAGILPVSKSSFSQWSHWHLPGKGLSRDFCGEFFWKGCLDVGSHRSTPHAGKVYRKRCRRWCHRAACPMCYENWASLEGHRAVRRMAQYRTSLKAIHVIVSPSVGDVELSYDDLKNKMYLLVKRVGIIGGMAIIHPFRSMCVHCQKDKERCNCDGILKGENHFEWFVSPHFHLICYGWVNGSAVGAVFESEGWIIKNLGVRKTVAGTITYQLSHAGVHHGNDGYCSVHGMDKDACRLANAYPFPNPPDCVIKDKEGKKATIVWFGALSYNKLKVDKSLMDEKDRCPLCDGVLHEIVFTMYDADFSDVKEGEEFYDEPDGWERLEPVGSAALADVEHVPAKWSDFQWQVGH